MSALDPPPALCVPSLDCVRTASIPSNERAASDRDAARQWLEIPLTEELLERLRAAGC
jgi:hypothetical protein